MVLLRAVLDAEVKSWSSQIGDCSEYSRSLSSVVDCHVLAEGLVSEELSVSFLAKAQDGFYRISLDELFLFSVVF